MEYISDRELLKTTLEKMGISGHFDSLGLQFHLVEYHKGELLVAPFKPMDQLLFLARGRVSIYGRQQLFCIPGRAFRTSGRR